MEDLQRRIDILEDQVNELEDSVEELESKVETLEAASIPYDALVASLTSFLSWLDHPPKDMDATSCALYLAQARRDLDHALREVAR